MLDAGIILVVTAIGLTQEDLEIIQTDLDINEVNVVWVGDNPTDITYDLAVSGPDDINEIIDATKTILQDKGIIFKP